MIDKCLLNEWMFYYIGVGSRINAPPLEVYNLIPRTFKYILLQGKRGFEDVITPRILEWKDYHYSQLIVRKLRSRKMKLLDPDHRASSRRRIWTQAAWLQVILRPVLGLRRMENNREIQDSVLASEKITKRMGKNTPAKMPHTKEFVTEVKWSMTHV